MVKHVKGWELSAKLEHQQNVYVRNVPGEKVRSTKDYVKPCIRDQDPEHIIPHVGMNELNLEIRSEGVAKSNVDLANSLISEK